MFCKRCTECLSLSVKQLYTAGDTVSDCVCAQGFQHGDESCSFCVQQCSKGEEPTERDTGLPCSAETFNSYSHQRIKWSSRFQSPNQQMVAAGTTVNDIICPDLKHTMSTSDIKPTGIPPKLDAAIICAC